MFLEDTRLKSNPTRPKSRDTSVLTGNGKAKASTTIPTRNISNGEFFPAPQSNLQRRVEVIFNDLSYRYAGKLGISRRGFLRTGCAMAAAFLAMNSVFGTVFSVASVETSYLEAAEQYRKRFAGQFVFDVQLHFVRDEYAWEPLLSLRRNARKFNPRLVDEKLTFEKFKVENFIKEVFLDSETTLGLLSGGLLMILNGGFSKTMRSPMPGLLLTRWPARKGFSAMQLLLPGNPVGSMKSTGPSENSSRIAGRVIPTEIH